LDSIQDVIEPLIFVVILVGFDWWWSKEYIVGEEFDFFNLL